ncbi:MAG: hypothetical protein Kow0077_16570 [Anaerolineae bacterium]
MIGQLTRNTLWLLSGNIGSALLSFLLTVLIARGLGERSIGVYGVVMAWVLSVRLLAEFGINTLLTRDVAADSDTGTDYLTQTHGLRAALGVAGWGALWLSAPVISRDPLVVAGLRISAPLVFVEPFFGALTAIFRARQRMWPIPALGIGMLGLQAVLVALVLASRGDILAVLYINLGTSALQALVAYAIYRWQFWRPATGLTLSLTWALRRAWPFALAAVLATLQARVGLMLLARLADTAQAGYFTASARFVEAIRLLPMAYFNALLPLLAALAAEPERLQRLFRRTIMLLLAGGGAVALAGLALSQPLVTLVLGEAFLPAAVVLQVALWGLVPGLVRGAWTLYGYALKQESRVNVVLGSALVAHLAGGLLLIPAYGALGAALAGLLSECWAVGIFWLWDRKTKTGTPVPGGAPASIDSTRADYSSPR